MKKFFLFILFLSVNTFAQLYAPADSVNPADTMRAIEYYEQHAALTDSASVNIVMLGNSITKGCNWKALLNRVDIAERGVVSDQLVGFKKRIPYIFKLNPKVIFIEGGINDIYNDTPVLTIYQNYLELISSIQARGIKVVLQSILYVNPKWKKAIKNNVTVEILNDMLSKYCKVNNIPYIDLNKHYSEDKILKDEYTRDGLHLYPDAYVKWGEEISKTLTDLGI